MESLPLLNDGTRTQVRLFRESDTERIHEIYMQAMLYGAGSPGNIALKYQSRKPFSFVLYGAFLLGLGLVYSLPTPIPGALLSLSSLSLFFAWRQNTWSKFKLFVEGAIKTDLADIAKCYGTKPSAFWVAELADGISAGKIIGCVGLDSTASQDSSTAELKRMVVDPLYQKDGAGSLLMTTLINHARTSGLSTISLSTSMYQTVAMSMYENFGFVKGRKVWVTVKFLFIVNKAYLQFFTLNL